MRRDVLDALAVDIDLAAVAQAFEVLPAGERPPFFRDGVFAFDSIHEGVLCSPNARAKKGESASQLNWSPGAPGSPQTAPGQRPDRTDGTVDRRVRFQLPSATCQLETSRDKFNPLNLYRI